MSTLSRRTALGSGLGLAALTLAPTSAQAGGPRRPSRSDAQRRWAGDTWTSMAAMADPDTGLVADNIDAELGEGSAYTSPTNIGGYLWSIQVARELRLITRGEAARRTIQVLDTLERMDRHDASGMYVNWYEPATGAMVRTWPESGEKVVPFVSSVDMGWLGAALRVVARAGGGSAARRARRLVDAMRWDVFFDRSYDRAPGANVGGFWLEQPDSADGVELLPAFNDVGGPDLWYHTGHHYDTAISEARMVTYLGIIQRQIPAGAYFTTYRTFPEDWTWAETPPVGTTRTYEGVDVYEGTHRYRGMRIVPGWGGSMFEELMPDLFVPEARWAPRSWGVNHALHVRAQREHGLHEAGYGYWGFSPCSNPAGGYREYGVDALGLNPDGYFSDQEMTNWVWDSPPTTYGDGVVTPHAGFLAMQYEADAGFENLSRIESELGCYGTGGFYDAAATRSGELARRYLSLDQSMILGALGNILCHGALRSWFVDPTAERRLRGVIGQEVFGAHR